MIKKAFVTGVTGQDGSYLAELLLKKGYSVAGLYPKGGNLAFVDNLKEKITLYEGDISDVDLLANIIIKEKPDEIYNLASIATVAKPWENPPLVLKVTGLAPVAILEIIRNNAPQTKLFQASSAEIFGDPIESPQSEITMFRPRSPYGMGKLLAHLAVGQYRTQHKIFATSGILFNHESPRRGDSFIIRKITKTLTHIKAGLEKELVVGNLSGVRDWGFAGDYVEAMWMMLHRDTPDDFVIASGMKHSVRYAIDIVSSIIDFPIKWEGENEKEVGKDKNGNIVVRISKDFYRPPEKSYRCGDISKIKHSLGWEPKTSFEELVAIMVVEEQRILNNQLQ